MPAPTQLYQIAHLLGRGAVASVHEVRDEQGQRFAGKFLHRSHKGDVAATARFAQEAALLEGVSHPNLVRVDGRFEGIDEQGTRRSFVRMELVEGIGLDTLIAREAPLDEARVLRFGQQLAAGLAHAHGRGIVHRDLKPANVLVAAPDSAEPVLKISDFGMARASSLSGLSGDALTIVGTPDYMAPECLDPIAVDARADLYALGCVLYEMVCAEPPYSAATPFGTIARHRDDPIPALPGHVSAGLVALIQALLAKSPADRPSSAGLVAERLAALERGEQRLALLLEVAGSRCASCGQPLLEQLAACLNCGLSAVTLEAGNCCVIITGPGAVGDKLDSAMRERLREWLVANPQMGLVAGKWLESKIPRMPIVFAAGLAERSAQALISSLEVLGFVAEIHRGLRLRHPGVRSKAGKLIGRVAVIALTSMGGLWQTGAAAIIMLGVGSIATMIGTSVHSVRAVTRRSGDPPRALGPALRAAFDGVETLAPALREPRHRHALRAVVRQSLDLRAQLGPEHSEAELAAAVVQASATTASLARIDEQLRTLNLNDASVATRELLHHRDHLAGRMAELSGALESLRIRTRVRHEGTEPPSLDELRERVEALEEVQAL